MQKLALLFILAILATSSAAAQSVVVVSAATFDANFPVAPESIATAFGEGLASTTAAATETPLPTSLGGVTVTVTDSASQSRVCPLFFVSPGQINFLVPAGVAIGTATIQVGPAAAALQPEAAPQTASTGTFEVAAVSTGIFTVTDLEWLAGFILRVDADGTQTFLPIVELVDGEIVPVPLEMSPGGDESAEFYLIVYGTGNRGSGDLATVETRIGLSEPLGQFDAITTLFNGPQGGFVGLDQTNAGPFDRSLEWFGGGDRPLELIVDGDISNTAWINVAPNPNAPVITNPSFELQAGSPPILVAEFDFTDPDADLGPWNVIWVFEDAQRFCVSGNVFDAGPFVGQTGGRVQVTEPKGFGVQLGPIERIFFSVGDAAGHVSNEIEFVPENLPGFAEPCDDIIEK